MPREPEIRISPDPTPEDREAILEALRTILEREEQVAAPPRWRLGGWSHMGTGVRDLGRWLTSSSRWTLSSRLPWGGREFGGLNGRGDAK